MMPMPLVAVGVVLEPRNGFRLTLAALSSRLSSAKNQGFTSS
jgi:hypothetical protein